MTFMHERGFAIASMTSKGFLLYPLSPMGERVRVRGKAIFPSLSPEFATPAAALAISPPELKIRMSGPEARGGRGDGGGKFWRR
jgi:hypothetical protein